MGFGTMREVDRLILMKANKKEDGDHYRHYIIVAMIYHLPACIYVAGFISKCSYKSYHFMTGLGKSCFKYVYYKFRFKFRDEYVQ